MPELSAASILIQLIEDYHSLNPEGIRKCPYPTSLEFSRQVSRGRPCVYRVKPEGSPKSSSRQAARALYLDYLKGRSESEEERAEITASLAFAWTAQSLSARVTGKVDVAVTPDGRADSIYSIRKTHSGRYEHRGGDDLGDEKNGRDHGNGLRNDILTSLSPRSRHSGDKFEQVFLEPASVQMNLSTLLSKLTSITTSTSSCSSTNPVYYLQSQNSNLTTTALSPLYDEMPETIPFAKPVLGEPDAVNLWVGGDRSITTTHRDPYENLYLVLRGSKTFTLWPPVEEMCLSAKMVTTGKFVLRGGGGKDGSGHDVDGDGDDTMVDSKGENEGSAFSLFELQLDDDNDDQQRNGRVGGAGGSDEEKRDEDTEGACSSSPSQHGRIPWIPIDPSLPRSTLEQLYPYYRHARPETVTVEAGEMLYLPAGWFHHVRQQCGQWDDGSRAPCVAVNYWFDMDYEGERYAFHQLITKLVDEVRNSSSQDLRPGGTEL
ncbi:hypothetical protein PV10_03417 [Exophiala mesophila]|uniref:JmjC domain-containing protein n=1 Tax=Exophiala mesophila TaxID=212818 RepID=A0A0D1Y542_EXOME|nr:uncharacterized protein PV10_03417 [Exophiala mesophila]KIV95811.1 hypothetical protein PV10_03417 [Exophiala mesophila]